ncbi:hypothetical protein HP550_10960 [Cellulomonas humilata]|uniref:DUF3618 domain-containing protein n=1 Tax=Cellulomonas humilata TaxID=144055 RepID=A0A7Y6DY76_9CELL|nr:hypothetical protein [Cellulomonas humilata]NUU17767.1 hypothetical protein [Cellulomonas humilata]
MTDDYTSSYPLPENGSTADTAKEQASTLKAKAADAGGHLLDDAKGEAAAVTQEARRQLGDLWSQARTEVTGQASTQQSRLAGGLTSVGGQLSQMASAPAEQNLATDLVREVGDKVDSLGRWLESHGPDEVLDEVRSFARRRPGTFLLVAAGAGVVLGRLTRGLKDAPPAAPTPAPVRTSVTEPLPVTAYSDPVEERPRFTDELATPVPSTTAWDQR